MIYLLDAKIIDENGDIKSCFSEVYSDFQKAISEGEKYLKINIQGFYYGDNFDYACEDYYMAVKSEKINKILKILRFTYNFTVTEIDLKYADNFKLPIYEYECRNLKPTKKIFNMNLEKEIEYVEIIYMDSVNRNMYTFCRYPRR